VKPGGEGGPQPPAAWTRILRMVLRGEEAERVEETLAELYASKRRESSNTADAWYRRQVLGFAVRLPALTGRGGWFAGRSGKGVDVLRQDLSFALRQFGRRPGFALLAMATAGLGVGAATAIFGMVRAVVLEPLPFPEPDRLVQVLELTPDGDDFITSESNFLDFHDRNNAFTALAAWQGSAVAARLGDEPVQLAGVRASAGFFDVLGGRAAVGRVFTEAETGADPDRVVVLSHRFWRDAFGGARDVVGRAFPIDGLPHVVIGVMPDAWEPFVATDVWLPQPLRPETGRDDHVLMAIGRLADGQTPASARADLMRIQRELGERFPDSNGGWGVDVRPLKASVLGEDTIRAGWVLLGAVGLLLLLACASVSNLLVARATEREREMGLRTALGAGRGRVLRQLATESVVLSVAGGALGVALAYVALPVLQALAPADTPRIGAARIDLIVLLFSIAAAMFAGLLFGVAPAAHTLRTDLRSVLAHGDRGSAGGGERLRASLVVVQVAVAFTLLVGVGLLGATFLRLQSHDPGLTLSESVAVPLTLPGERYDASTRRRVLSEMRERIAAMPGVAAVGAVNIRPFSGSNTVNALSIEGMAFPANGNPSARWRAVSPGYLDAAGVRLVAGRDFRTDDQGPGGGEQAVAIVNITMATEIWGSPEAALGRRLAMSRNSTNWMRIIGVTEDVVDVDLALGATSQFFFPDGGWWPWMTLVIRSERDATSLASAIRSAIREVDSDLPVPIIEPVALSLRRETAAPRFNFGLMLVFGAVALVLALMGVYGVTHLAVSRRSREIGIRLALGAHIASTARLLLAGSARLAVAGIAIGLALAFAGANALGSLLFRTSPMDPFVLAGAAVLVLATSLLAAWIPARRAARIDPASILRMD
jgi:predicted permease